MKRIHVDELTLEMIDRIAAHKSSLPDEQDEWNRTDVVAVAIANWLGELKTRPDWNESKTPVPGVRSELSESVPTAAPRDLAGV